MDTKRLASDSEIKLKEEKDSLRRHYRALRKGAPYKNEAAEALKKNFISFFSLYSLSGKIVSGYVPMDGEIDVFPLMRYIGSTSAVVLVPIVKEDSILLTFRKWEECPNLLGEIDAIPSIVIVPLVAFDVALSRLGFGGGYYDRTINFLRKNNRESKFIGVAYEIQLCDHIPVNEHDQKLDAVITDKTIYS
ncbi:MAG: 5-formyltetrahydrofolate cyclo-ligase [Aaplasma endosymbiont of Hyalomma asiaticum]